MASPLPSSPVLLRRLLRDADEFLRTCEPIIYHLREIHRAGMQFRAGSMSNTAHIQRLQQRSNHVHRLTLQLGKPWNSLLPYLDAPNEVSKAVAASFDGDAGSGSPANEAGKDA